MTTRATLAAPEARVAEFNHRIGNNLVLVAGMVRLHAASISAEQTAVIATAEVLAVLRDVEARIENIGRLHHLLAEAEFGSLVDLGDYLRAISVAAVSSLSFGGRVMLASTPSAGCVVLADQALSIGLIVAELLTNALKYGHPTRLSIGCRRTVERMILVEVADDGTGLPAGFDPMTQGGFGLGLVRSLAKRLGAKLRFQSGRTGLRIRLVVPTAQTDQHEARSRGNGLRAKIANGAGEEIQC